MTWGEFKTRMELAGVRDDEDVYGLEVTPCTNSCRCDRSEHTLHPIRSCWQPGMHPAFYWVSLTNREFAISEFTLPE